MNQMKYAFMFMRVLKGWTEMTQPGSAARILKHSDGFIAREVVQGSKNRSLGFVIFDPKGNRIGMVRTIRDLP